jgi:hypothetical protein
MTMLIAKVNTTAMGAVKGAHMMDVPEKVVWQL